ncbi:MULTISPECIES: hypothetical protein [Pseudomonas]|jgi:hypothetical protein|uniref:Uncharacterized protein n=1 Tax=Pseudomonas marincola TaxID=437900 RepID=A0A1I7CPK0_9PSED|nr:MULTISPECIES: hypothetical protein [Pseudomonas]MAB99672.1 hypothetical protein [Pseudomonadaceae bacterium]MBQ56334.1 hypothetical protein [Pseudomonadaceae bacterium]NRH28273.1 hypothetical protein [Pseudomonas sp. MS19]OEO27704.1 hypothetical protein AX279_00900 [Pseudomonas sp. J237]CAE6899612.1 conserved exported protein of unknown function [Pseudomonas marincola]|tara:strand:- start:52 stop:276 length:225 start_codon:yes stop_codon:yes gene_type:complete
MKLEIARGVFLVGALAVASAAFAAWQEPQAEVLTQNTLGYCPAPPHVRQAASAVPDKDLLLFMFGMSQAMRGDS